MSIASIYTTHLIGDWTIVGIVQQVRRLAEFSIGGARPGTTVVVDCSGIDGIDLSGFQLLFVWLHCIQMSGLRPKLLNMPVWMRDAQERLCLTQVFENELQTCEPDIARVLTDAEMEGLGQRHNDGVLSDACGRGMI